MISQEFLIKVTVEEPAEPLLALESLFELANTVVGPTTKYELIRALQPKEEA